FASDVPGGGAAMNTVTFTAAPALAIPANFPTLPGFCTVTFRVKVLGTSIDSTPDKIEQLVGYGVASCDNGVLVSGGFQTSAITTPLTHFSCYQVPRGGIPTQTVSVVDRFGATT